MKFPKFAIIIFALIFISCSSFETIKTDKIVDEYTTIFPNKDVANELEQISQSLKLINNLTFYKVYSFLDSTVTNENMDDFDLLQKANSVNTISKTSSGTGAIISISGNKVAILTVAHIISYPDTIISYFTNFGKQSKYIESILYKERQKIYSDLPEGGMLKIIAMDEKNDIAIVGNSFDNITPLKFSIFKFNFGKAKELK